LQPNEISPGAGIAEGQAIKNKNRPAVKAKIRVINMIFNVTEIETTCCF
jgi:hypothetical protein